MGIRLWLDVLLDTFSFVTSLVKVIFRTTHSLNYPEPSIPTFQYSNIPIMSEAS